MKEEDMELIQVIQHIAKFVPGEYSYIVDMIIPIIILTISLLVCFLGYRLVKIWSKIYFFVIGFLIGSFSGVFFIQYSIDINVFIGIGIVLGIAGIYFSSKLHKLQIFIVNFVSIYLILPNILSHFLTQEMSIIIGLIIAIIIGIVAVKYRYPITVTTSSIHGGFFAISQIMQIVSYNNNLVLYIAGTILTVVGILIQSKIGKEEEKEEKNSG